jgi:hypothetical protein
MANFTPAEVWTAVLAFASAIVLLSNAAEKVGKAIQTAKAPNARLDERMGKAEKHLEEIDGYLAVDRKRLDSLDDGTRATQRALLALLDHGIDGNNIEQMQHAKEALQNHLINR